jgi:hypothetical protein
MLKNFFKKKTDKPTKNYGNNFRLTQPDLAVNAEGIAINLSYEKIRYISHSNTLSFEVGYSLVSNAVGALEIAYPSELFWDNSNTEVTERELEKIKADIREAALLKNARAFFFEYQRVSDEQFEAHYGGFNDPERIAKRIKKAEDLARDLRENGPSKIKEMVAKMVREAV